MPGSLFIAYWDNQGFECILDLTGYDKKAMWATLADKPHPTDLPIHQMIMRAKLNPHRFPEIWTFHSEIDIETLLQYSRDVPQALADAIRENGERVFVTPKQKEVIV